MDKKSILIFGLAFLQKSLILRCKSYGLYTIGIDPCKDAACRDLVDVFEVVDGQDFETTLKIARKYNIKGVITTATDKPLIMMARIAEALRLPCFSVDTAILSTDKLLMKQKFIENKIQCAKGFVLEDINTLSEHVFDYPVIVKPRDNSGSRGVIYCQNKDDVRKAWNEAIQYTKKTSVLIEEYIDGPEYSIESIHFNGNSEVVQFTEKQTTDFPYNVELGHIQPAVLHEEHKKEIRKIISLIGRALNFFNCCSHTELKISSRGVTVIETSPRLGGDFITSHLVPLSTGINLEEQLIRISIGENPDICTGRHDRASAVYFFHFKPGVILTISDELLTFGQKENVSFCDFQLKVGDRIPSITNSLNRYGEFIVAAQNREEIDSIMLNYNKLINRLIRVK